MIDFIRYLGGLSGKAVVLSHQNADPDAVASSIVLKEAIASFNPSLEVELAAAGGISKISKRIAEKFGEEFSIKPSLDVDVAILLDTSTLAQLHPISEEIKKASKIAVIDHHAPHEDTRRIADFYIVEEASSTAEIIYRLIAKMGVEMDGRMGLALLAGIIADTAHLRFATSKTIEVVGEIIKTGADYVEAIELLEIPEDVSQKISHLKAAQRMEITKVNDWVLAISHVSAFEASAATALVHLGADCTFVGSEGKEGIQISARASPNFIKESGVHLGRDVMKKIGEFINGSGGGHAGAAGAKGKDQDLKKALEECLRVLQEALLEKM
jgi:nanoRNase/pAp phosphatase (c-di-AMP/oligoRNAs hydrolase)